MFARLAVSVAVAFLGAYPFSELSGIAGAMRDSEARAALAMVSGIILFFLALSLSGPVVRLVQTSLQALKQAETRPGPKVALTMLCLGTLCVIAALFVQYSAGRSSSGLTMNVGDFTRNPQFVMQTSGSAFLGLLTLLTFLVGGALIALGTWASLKPPAQATSLPVKPDVPELKEAPV
jgi:hypothetical protein